MCLISYLCLLCLSTYLSRPSDVFAPYLLRIKVPKSEEGTKEIRSKWVCEGTVEGEVGMARQNAKSEDEGQDNGGLWRGIWLVIFRYDCVCGCGK